MSRVSHSTTKCVLPFLTMCLILSHGRDELRFSHFSVQEYLVSERILISTSPSFRIVEPTANELVAKICLVYLLSLCYTTVLERKHVDLFPFSRYSAKYWPRHLHASEPHRRMILESTLARRLFELSPMNTWVRVYDPDNDHRAISNDTDVSAGPTRIFAPPLYYSSLLGFINVTRWLLDGDTNINTRGRHFGKGADVNGQGGFFGNAL